MLDAARDLFSEKGFHNVTMHEIAQRSEFSIGALYSFFRNKEDLYRELMLDLTRKFQSALDDALRQGTDERDKIVRYLRAKGEIFCDNVKIVRLFYAEMLGASYNLQASLNQEIRDQYLRLVGELVEVFRSGQLRGLFGAAPAESLALWLDSCSTAELVIGLDGATWPEGRPYSRQIESMLSVFCGPAEGAVSPPMKPNQPTQEERA